MATINLLQGTALNNITTPFVYTSNLGTFGQYNFHISNPADLITAATSAGGLTTYSFPPDLPKYYFAIIECEWSGTMSTVGGGATLTFQKLYRLPLPSPLIEGKQINYDGGGNWLNTIGTAVNALGAAVPGASILTSAITAAAAGFVGAGSSILGLAVNDLKSVTLKAPQYLVYNHSFKLVPKTFAESEIINNILWSLRAGMHPTQTAFVMRFPKIYLPMFIPNMKYLFKFKPCVIQALSIDFEGGNGLPAFYANPNGSNQNIGYGSVTPPIPGTDIFGLGKYFSSTPSQQINYTASDNPPESVILNIQWLELEYWLRPDFNASNNPFDAYNWFTNGGPANQGAPANQGIV